MKRQYISTAHAHAPFEGAYYLSGYDTKQGVFGPGGHGGGIFQTTVSGLGAWPAGRTYWSTANFRAPYDHGYFQDNNLMGVREDSSVALRQIPTWVYATGGALMLAWAFRKYQKGTK